MGKRILNLYVDDELIEMAKNRGFNLSRFFNELLAVELRLAETADATDKEELIAKLKSKVAMLQNELKLSNEEKDILNKKIKELETIKLEKEKKDNKPKIIGYFEGKPRYARS